MTTQQIVCIESKDGRHCYGPDGKCLDCGKDAPEDWHDDIPDWVEEDPDDQC